MLDQSFSADNFRKILDQENRKGLYLEKIFFPSLKRITAEIKQCNEKIKEKKKNKSKNKAELKELYEKKKELKQDKEKQLTDEFQKVSDKVVLRSFEIEIKKIAIPNKKPIYTINNDSPEQYFAMKQLQRNVSRLFGIKQANRSAIVSQVKVLLGDKFPKYVLRTDIKDFYESIPHEKILEKINGNNLLSPFSRKILRRILKKKVEADYDKNYKGEAGIKKGVPRGIGVSAYLAELYMRDIDERIKTIDDVTYYARYVDDIIIIFTPSPNEKDKDYKKEIKKIIEEQNHLTLNPDKTQPFDLRDKAKRKSCDLDYLGYRMTFGTDQTKIIFTEKKVKKYKTRIDLAFDAYTNFSKGSEKKARKLLVRRIRFLTGNTRLTNNKKNILIGIYYSNSHLTEHEILKELDGYLENKITQIEFLHEKQIERVQKRLGRYSFKEGYEEKKFSPFKTKELSDIMEVWQ